MEFQGKRLDPFQEKAVEAIRAGESVIVAAPTGSGKTLLAEYAVEQAMEAGQQVVYTAPIKALSNQKFRDFSRRFPGKVGIVTGDVGINPTAPLVVMTTEIFRNAVLEDPARAARIRWAVLDEVHFIDDAERGTVWEEVIMYTPPGVDFICLSATVPNLEELAQWMRNVRGRPVRTVLSRLRPVPLDLHLVHGDHGIVGLDDLQKLMEGSRPRRGGRPPRRQERGKRVFGMRDLVRHLRKERRTPCLWFCFSRKLCELNARRLSRTGLVGPARANRILERFESLSASLGLADLPLTARMRELVVQGVAFHHAGLLPMMKELVERLFGEGLIEILFTTETFAMGINMPAASVVLESLMKFDGVEFAPMSARDFQQMSGRAGRRGMDERGYVYVRLDDAECSPRRARQILAGACERIESRFNLAYATLLNLYEAHGRDLDAVFDRSFLEHQRGESRGGRHAHREAQRRLTLLENLGYIDERGLTGKGRLAAGLCGLELQVVEIEASGLLETATPEDLAVLFGVLTFEPRRGTSYTRMRDEGPQGLFLGAAEIIRRLKAEERRQKLDTIPDLDFRIARTIRSWCNEYTLTDLGRLTSADEGDLVRMFRRAVQLLRLTATAYREHRSLSSRLWEAVRIVNRGEVNAEEQLLGCMEADGANGDV